MERASAAKLPLTLLVMFTYISSFTPTTTEARCKPHKHSKLDVLAPSPAPPPPPPPPATLLPAPTGDPLAPVSAPEPSVSEQLEMYGCGKSCNLVFCEWPCNHCCENYTCCLDPRIEWIEPGQPIPPMPSRTFECGGFCRDSDDCGYYSECSMCCRNNTCCAPETVPDLPPPPPIAPSALPPYVELKAPEPAPNQL